MPAPLAPGYGEKQQSVEQKFQKIIEPAHFPHVQGVLILPG
jgi:hypothetical protein